MNVPPTSDERRTAAIADFDPHKHAWITFDYIAAHPELHDQNLWVGNWAPTTAGQAIQCGTAACFAGWFALLAGCELSSNLESTQVIESGGERSEIDYWVAEQIEVPLASAYDCLYSAGLTVEQIGEGLTMLIGPRNLYIQDSAE